MEGVPRCLDAQFLGHVDGVTKWKTRGVRTEAPVPSSAGSRLVFCVPTERRAQTVFSHGRRDGAEQGAKKEVLRERPVVGDQGTSITELRHVGVRGANEARNELRPFLICQRK